MKLLTKELEERLKDFPLYSQKDKGDDAVVICKFFNPVGTWKWYVLEGEKVGEDYTFFGLVDGFEREYGYFMLSELESVRLPFGLKIERDILFEECKISDIR